jgi:hypothetical protein
MKRAISLLLLVAALATCVASPHAIAGGGGVARLIAPPATCPGEGLGTSIEEREAAMLSARCWRAGENLAWGSGDSGSVRSAFSLLIHSPEHRENILGDYTVIGIGLRIGTLAGNRDAQVWTQHFGSHCGAARHPRFARLSRARQAS